MSDNLEFPIRVHQWSPNGKYLAATLYQEDRSHLVLFSVADAGVRVIRTQGIEALSYISYFGKMKFSPDGRFVAYSPTDVLRVLELRTGFTHSITAQRPFCLSWSPDGARLAAREGDGKIRIYATPTLNRLREVSLAGTSRFRYRLF